MHVCVCVSVGICLSMGWEDTELKRVLLKSTKKKSIFLGRLACVCVWSVGLPIIAPAELVMSSID